MEKSAFRFNCGNLECFTQMLCEAIKQHTDENGGLYLTPNDIHYIIDSYRYLLVRKAIAENAPHSHTGGCLPPLTDADCPPPPEEDFCN